MDIEKILLLSRVKDIHLEILLNFWLGLQDDYDIEEETEDRKDR